MVEGWNKIYRSIQEHWLWTCEPFSRGQAWIDLLLMANHKTNKIMINGTLEVVERGQRVTSIRKLADRWKWSTKKVSHFLEQLVKDNMIEYISDTSKTVITILNYDKYQGKETPQTIDNTRLGEDIGNTKETARKQLGNTEETQKKNERITEEKQKKTNKNDKEYIKNDKEGEEGKEIPSSLPPLSILSPIQKDILNIVGETTFRTFLWDADIKEIDNRLEIKMQKGFHRDYVDSRLKEKIKINMNKEVQILE